MSPINWLDAAAVEARLTTSAWGYWIGYSNQGNDWLWSSNADPGYTNWRSPPWGSMVGDYK